MSLLLQEKLSRTRRRHDLVALATGLSAFLFTFLSLLALAALLDYLSPLSLPNRAALLLMNLTFSLYLLTRRSILPILHAPDQEDLALQIERLEPSLGTRLIASIQLTRPGALAADSSSSLVAALVHQTETLAESLNFSKVIPTTQLKKFAALAALILLTWMTFFLTSPATASILLKRSLLFPNIDALHRTTITSATGDLVVPRGEPITLFAEAAGKLPDTGSLLIIYASGRTADLLLDHLDPNPHHFQRQLDNPTESFTYTIRLNDTQSPVYHVEVRPRPTLQSIQFHQIYPTYTHLPPIDRAPSDLVLLAGSQLSISIKSDTPLKDTGNNLRLIGPNTSLSLTRDPSDPTHLTIAPFAIPPTTTGLSIDLLDDHNIPSKDPVLYPIEITPDHPPTIKLTSPTSHQTLITPSATLPIGLDASDDIALGKILLMYQIKPAPPQSIELDMKGAPKSLQGSYNWKPKSQTSELPIGATIEYWLEAQDTNILTGPGRAESDHYELHIVSEEAKRADLMSRMSDNFRQLDEVTQSQQDVNAQLGKVLTEKAPEH